MTQKPSAPASGPSIGTAPPTAHRHVDVNGLSIFYREAGLPDAPALLLLHGFPSSSRMFRNLIPALADRYRVIAPDYPAFGHSEAPPRDAFEYSFTNFTAVIEAFLDRLGIGRYALYVHDFGAPVGLGLALSDPTRISALIVQNGNAYEEGLSGFFAPLHSYWADPTHEKREVLRGVLTLEMTRWQYVEGVREPVWIDPDNWLIDHALLSRSGIAEVMLDLFYDYRVNLSLYPSFQAFFREYRPPTLIVWGKGDPIFATAGAQAYLHDMPDAQLHLLPSGHFALEDMQQEIAVLVRAFLGETLE